MNSRTVNAAMNRLAVQNKIHLFRGYIQSTFMRKFNTYIIVSFPAAELFAI